MINSAVDLVIQFGLMFVVGAMLAMVLMAVSHRLAPTSRNPNKGLPYECGVLPAEDARLPYNVHFYLVAVLFVLFDLEAVFMYPWALALRQIGTLGLVEMLIFIFILLVGYFYAWKKGVLDWE
ncbi:MAG: NADH-quinone oxidoreductase subunit A [Thermoleophilia bacterium]